MTQKYVVPSVVCVCYCTIPLSNFCNGHGFLLLNVKDNGYKIIGISMNKNFKIPAATRGTNICWVDTFN